MIRNGFPRPRFIDNSKKFELYKERIAFSKINESFYLSDSHDAEYILQCTRSTEYIRSAKFVNHTDLPDDCLIYVIDKYNRPHIMRSNEAIDLYKKIKGI